MHAILRRAALEIARHRYWRPLEQSAERPDVAQTGALRALLAANRETTFGREHGFAGIDGPRAFRERVPVHEYEALRPYIDRQRQTGERALTVEAPLFYAQTSGTTGTPKYVPVTPAALALYRAEQALFSYLQYRACPEAFSGMAMGVMGAAVEGRLDSGHAVGSVSGHLYASLPGYLRARAVVPPEVSSIADYEVKYQVILHLALAQPGITYMGSPNPSTFVRLLDVLHARRDTLLAALATGRSALVERLEPGIRAVVAARMPAMPARAAVLGRLSALTYGNVWPGLRLVTTWTGGSCGIALAALRRTLPGTARVMELGYQATECRGTIALEAEAAGGLPPLGHAFFEFVERQAWDAGRPEYLTVEALTSGRQYYVLVTTVAGLYRYFMNDLVEVTGTFRRTPLLRFVQKGRGVTNLTGEKLYEAQVIDAVQGELAGRGLVSRFFAFVADPGVPGYQLYVEGLPELAGATGLAEAVDRRLGDLNIEYRSKRESGRLAALVVRSLRPGTADAYKAAAVSAGQREGQLKLPVLLDRKDVLLPLDDHLVAR
jgi:hypothetical protein